MRLFLVLTIYLFPVRGLAQTLVPNGSFEANLGCPNNNGKIWLAEPWRSVRGSCDYLHECGTNGFGIPISQGGGGYARTGQAYSRFNVWTTSNTIEVLGAELTDELDEGVRYRVEFYLSLLDSVWYASKNIGAYFSTTQPYNNIDSIRNCQPQVRYDGDFITNKEGWTLVSGSFVAQGGEKFMSIGNFDKYEETETLFVPGGGGAPSHSAVYWEVSAYFIDDVSVVPDSITSVPEEQVVEEGSYSLYPNPNMGAFTIELRLQEQETAQLQVWNLAGQQIHTQTLGNGINALKMDAAKGLYLYGIAVNGAMQWTGKVSISSQ